MPPCGRPRRKQSFQMRHHDRGSPEKPEKGKRQASFWESDKAARTVAQATSWQQGLASALPGRRAGGQLRRGERDQSAEHGPRAEPIGVPQWVEDQAGGRRNDAGVPGVGIRGSPRSPFLGTERGAPSARIRRTPGTLWPGRRTSGSSTLWADATRSCACWGLTRNFEPLGKIGRPHPGCLTN
jgi:hypothetical protein